MISAVRYGTLLVLLTVAIGCSRDVEGPTAPSSRPEPTVTPATPNPIPPAPAFPAVTRPARVYFANVSTYFPIHGSTLASRYVLYDDGTFALQYASVNYPFFEYRGTYAVTGSLITFSWEGWSTAGPWGATGSLTEDSLSVKYNLVMQLSDFEDGVYTRVR